MTPAAPDPESRLADFLGETLPPAVFATPLTDALAAQIVERLKQEADRYWYIDPHRSLEYADRIINIGRRRDDNGQMALGYMARGDALKLLGSMPEAWEALEQSGLMFSEARDEVGWARTRIGRLYVGLKLNQVGLVLTEAKRARQVFLQHAETEKCLRLDLNTALVHAFRGDYGQALDVYQATLVIAETLGEPGQQYLGALHLNIGMAYDSLGDFRRAQAYYQQAQTLMLQRQEAWHLALVEINLAYIARCQGQYRRALRLLHAIIERTDGQFPQEAALARENLAGCYLLLNRYVEARDLAREAIAAHRALGDTYEAGRTLLHLVMAEAELANFAAAHVALDEAEPFFEGMGATSLVMLTRLWRGELALRQGEAAEASRLALEVAAHFEANGQRANDAMASTLLGRAALARGDLRQSETASQHALRIAQHDNVPGARYAAHLLLGHIAEAQGHELRAARRYRAAAATVERVQRGLTVTLRPHFLEDKGEALRALMALHLRAGRAEQALDTLERAKSQVWLSYLSNREQLRWTHTDPHNQALLEELNHLRAEHHWFYSLAHDLPKNLDRPNAVSLAQARQEMTARERRMRSLTEQLYVRSTAGQRLNHVPCVAASDIQRALADGVCLVEFYNDSRDWWAFVVTPGAITPHRLALTTEEFQNRLAQFQTNVSAALRLGAQAAPLAGLTHLAQSLLQKLFAGLLAPLRLDERSIRQLVIVPYGALHYLPFHLLRDGASYLIEQYEVVTLPAAGLLTRPTLRRPRAAVALAHSRAGQLLHTHAEAQMVQRLFGGQVWADEAATRAVLAQPPQQILHLAAHGQHRLDQPDLSYLELADGQLYADDLMQHDLSYELITLSACETGQAHVAGGDELIGLGRSLLYAGAGALVTSLWPVADAITVNLMEHFYRALSVGASKAAALREAQQALLKPNPLLHPAYWGAFQLVGEAGPLSNG